MSMIVIMNLIIGLHNMNQVQGTGLKEVLNYWHSRAIYAMHIYFLISGTCETIDTAHNIEQLYV